MIFQVTVLPPGEWDPSIRIEPPDAVPLQGNRLDAAKSGGNGDGEGHDPAGDREEQLQKTGRLELLQVRINESGVSFCFYRLSHNIVTLMWS